MRQQLERVEGGEVEVEHDGRRRLVVQQAQRARVAEADADVVGGTERPGELVEELRVVVDDRQGLFGCAGHSDLPPGQRQSSVSAGRREA